MDHGAFSLHVAYLVADLVEEKTGKKFDKLDLFKRALFSIFFNCAYSDISSDVKARVKQLRPDIYAQLCHKMHKGVLSWKLPKNIQTDLEAFTTKLNSETRDIEADLFSYSKLVSAYYEALFSARVYPEVYAGPIEVIRQRLKEPRFADFRAVLDVEKDMKSVRFILSVRRLESAFRWNRLKRSYPVSVMSHLFIVATLSYFLFKIEGRSDEDVTEAILRSMYHDVPEAITGDIVTPTKKAAAGLEELITEIEEEFVLESMLVHLEGHSFEPVYAQRLLAPWGDDLGKLVKQADHLCAFLEARIEEIDNPTGEQFKRSREYVALKIREGGYKSAKLLLEDFDEGLRIYMSDSSIGMS